MARQGFFFQAFVFVQKADRGGAHAGDGKVKNGLTPSPQAAKKNEEGSLGSGIRNGLRLTC
jgi:hypothetical protein